MNAPLNIDHIIAQQTSANSDDLHWSEEREEWLDSMRYILQAYGPERAQEVLLELQRLLERRYAAPQPVLNTPYRNTIPVAEQPPYPGDIDLEQRIEDIIRWNAMAMVLRGNDNYPGLGGHIATYGSAATLYEVAFNHFFT